MIIRATTDYAIRIMAALSGADGAVSSGALAQNTGVPQKYLFKVASTLKASGLLNSVQGFRGGYMLSRPANEITLWEILCCVDASCRSVDTPDGPEASPIVARLFGEVNALMRRHFSDLSLADLSPADGPANHKEPVPNHDEKAIAIH